MEISCFHDMMCHFTCSVSFTRKHELFSLVLVGFDRSPSLFFHLFFGSVSSNVTLRSKQFSIMVLPAVITIHSGFIFTHASSESQKLDVGCHLVSFLRFLKPSSLQLPPCMYSSPQNMTCLSGLSRQARMTCFLIFPSCYFQFFK